MEGRRAEIDPVWITNVMTVTSLGDNLDRLWERLLGGESGIGPVRRFPVDTFHSGVAACIENLDRFGEGSMIHDLLDRLFRAMPSIPSDSFLITATTKAGIDNLEHLCRNIAADPRDILPSVVCDAIFHNLGLSGGHININASCASSTIALARGAALIALGRTDVVLVCCLDLVTEFVFSGFSSLHAVSPHPCMPFDRDRKGLTLGEGAAALLLMSPERGKKEGRFPLGTVMGWSVTNDATHITAPSEDGCGLIQAVRKALRKAGLEEEDIASICAHGTGTIYNDMMELTAFNEVFGRRKIPIYSVKGAIGHTMGAAGGIEAAICLRSLESGIVPPTTGFRNPEKGAEGMVRSNPVPMVGDYVLSTNSGFGGVNAAIILGNGSRP
jgi:3-oxoacyl-[acyl-carrier-protein] synthase II